MASSSKNEFSVYYLELSSDPVRFDSVSQLTNVYFDDSKQQVFAVRSGGATGIVVKSSEETISFNMNDRGPIRFIKFSPDNNILAVQRSESSVEFWGFVRRDGEWAMASSECFVHKSKNAIYGFVWVAQKEVALIGNSGIELFQVLLEKRQLKLIKSSNMTINWFSWCPASNFALLSSNNGALLTPVLLKSGVITKLPKLELEAGKTILERDVTLGVLYGTSSVLILQQTPNRLVEVLVFMLNGPGLAPRKCHILRLAHNGRFAMNLVDDLVIVHHQATKTSHLFDVLLPGERDAVTGVTTHVPLAPGKPIKPVVLKLPSLSYDTANTMECELYSPNWVLFQPNIVIDAKLGCLWNVVLKLEPLSHFIGDYVKLVDFLLRRTGGKMILLAALHDLLSSQYSGIKLPIIETIFDKLNVIYKDELDNELLRQMAVPSNRSAPQVSKNTDPPRVLIDQSDMFSNVFSTLSDSSHLGHVLMLYIHSLAKHKITLQYDLSKMIIMELVRTRRINTLHQLLNLSVINESKPLACFLLSLSKTDRRLMQAAMDMLARLNAHEIILEVLLEQGRVTEALRMAKLLPSVDSIPARKYLEAAMKTKDAVVFYSVIAFFQQRNLRLRGSTEFLRQEQCGEYIQLFQKMTS